MTSTSSSQPADRDFNKDVKIAWRRPPVRRVVFSLVVSLACGLTAAADGVADNTAAEPAQVLASHASVLQAGADFDALEPLNVSERIQDILNLDESDRMDIERAFTQARRRGDKGPAYVRAALAMLLSAEQLLQLQGVTQPPASDEVLAGSASGGAGTVGIVASIQR